MYSRLLDDHTLAAVIAAAPPNPACLTALARQCLAVLALESEAPIWAQLRRQGEQAYWVMPVGCLAQLVEGATPRAVGQALRELGFKTKRLNRGYQVAWNETQLTLLRRALNLRDPRIPAQERNPNHGNNRL